MDDSNVIGLFTPLYKDLRPEDAFNIKKPLLAHYTTIETLERILQSNEIWFSNPLFMNDLEEIRFGILEGNKLVMESEEIAKACGTKERGAAFRHFFNHYFGQFDTEHVLNTYVFCMSEHDRLDTDGLLSMWRGYMPDRDQGKRLAEMFHYAISSRGVQPKLRYKVLPIEGVTAPDLSLEKIIDRIILGPTISTPLATASVRRMFDVLDHPNLKPKLRPSTIPFRSIA